MKKYSLFLYALIFCLQGYTQQWTYATRFGGTASGFSDAVKAICTDASGNVYATGNFNSTINFGNGTASLTATTGGTATDGFVAKFNSAGLCQWSMRFGGSATDQGGLGIVTNGTVVYVTGQSQFPATIGSTALATVGGGTDGVVFALDASSGGTLWAKAFGGGATNDQGQAICLDGSGNVYISGVFSTRTSNPTASFGTTGAFPRTVQGSMASATSDMFVAQLNASTGAFNWVSSGGAFSQASPLIVGNDNITGSGIAYVPTTNQLVVVGSFNASTASYFSNGSSTASVTLTNAGQADMYVIRMDLSGNFVSGLAAGGATNDEALGVTYDAGTGAAYIAGYFNSTNVTGAMSLTNSAATYDEIFYARYDPVGNTVEWAKSASGPLYDAAFGIASNGTGQVYVTGRYQSSISFPTASAPLTAASLGVDDIFLLNVDPETGNAFELATGNGATGTDAGLAVATSTNHDVWTGGIVAGGTVSFSPSSPAVSVTVAVDQEMFIAKYNDPPPVISTPPQPVTDCAFLPETFSVQATGSSLLYQWQVASDAAFSSPTALTNTGIYSNVTSPALGISDNSTVGGKYYRVIVRNGGGSVTSSGALLTVNTPSLPTTAGSLVQTAGSPGNLFYLSGCSLLDKVVPSGASPVTGSISSRVWIESTVPIPGTQPFVQRHYQITPATNPTTATGTVTLYFTQAEFDAFNAAPGSLLKLPTGPGDAVGISNLRIGKYSGTSNDGSGFPASYTGSVTVIDPTDANIVWNASYDIWSVTFDVAGFSGFIVQTSISALPINLVSFTAKPTGSGVLVAWSTSDEIDNDHFEVERSLDGRVFDPVATVAAGAGAGAHHYSWVDGDASGAGSGRVFYRLKIVSVSGSVEYSYVVTIDNNGSSGLVSAAGNPFSGPMQLNLHIPAASRLVLKVHDLNGKLLAAEDVSVAGGASLHTVRGTEQLGKGVYVVSVYYNSQWYRIKMIKL